MNARTGKKLSKKELVAFYTEVAKECTPRIISAVLLVLINRRWSKAQLRKLFEDIYDVYNMPDILGRPLMDSDVIPYVMMRSGITESDWARLKSAVRVVVTDE